MNCILIEMGEMACYTERCPDCGRVPPGRKKAKPPDLLRKLVGRKFSSRRQSRAPATARMMMEAGTRTLGGPMNYSVNGTRKLQDDSIV